MLLWRRCTACFNLISCVFIVNSMNTKPSVHHVRTKHEISNVIVPSKHKRFHKQELKMGQRGKCNEVNNSNINSTYTNGKRSVCFERIWILAFLYIFIIQGCNYNKSCIETTLYKMTCPTYPTWNATNRQLPNKSLIRFQCLVSSKLLQTLNWMFQLHIFDNVTQGKTPINNENFKSTIIQLLTWIFKRFVYHAFFRIKHRQRTKKYRE